MSFKSVVSKWVKISKCWQHRKRAIRLVADKRYKMVKSHGQKKYLKVISSWNVLFLLLCNLCVQNQYFGNFLSFTLSLYKLRTYLHLMLASLHTKNPPLPPISKDMGWICFDHIWYTHIWPAMQIRFNFPLISKWQEVVNNNKNVEKC